MQIEQLETKVKNLREQLDNLYKEKENQEELVKQTNEYKKLEQLKKEIRSVWNHHSVYNSKLKQKKV